MKRSNIIASLLFLLSLTGFYAAPAAALCVTPGEAGAWTNVDANTRGIVRANVRFQCQDQILNGQPYPPGEPFYIKLYGSCHPTACEWQEVGANSIAGGWLRGTIDQGFAKRDIRFKRLADGRLRVIIYTDFRDPGRRDYRSDELFNRN